MRATKLKTQPFKITFHAAILPKALREKKQFQHGVKYGEIAGRLPRKLQKGYALECLFIFQHFDDWNDLMLSKNLLL